MFANEGTCAVRRGYMACSIDSSILLRIQTAVPSWGPGPLAPAQATSPRFPQVDGVESKAKQTSTNPKRHRYIYLVYPIKPAPCEEEWHASLCCFPSPHPRREVGWTKLRSQNLSAQLSVTISLFENLHLVSTVCRITYRSGGHRNGFCLDSISLSSHLPLSLWSYIRAIAFCSLHKAMDA